MYNTLGAVSLFVSDLEHSLHYYQHNIGLKLHRREAAAAYLGVGGSDLLILQEKSGGQHVEGVTGTGGIEVVCFIATSSKQKHLWGGFLIMPSVKPFT